MYLSNQYLALALCIKHRHYARNRVFEARRFPQEYLTQSQIIIVNKNIGVDASMSKLAYVSLSYRSLQHKSLDHDLITTIVKHGSQHWTRRCSTPNLSKYLDPQEP